MLNSNHILSVLPISESKFWHQPLTAITLGNRPSTRNKRMPKLKFQTNLKVQAMTRHFQDGEPISSISADLRVPPAVCEQWCKEVISNLSLFFDQSLKKQEREKDRRIEELQSEVVRKQEVIGEIMEAFTTLKKKNGAN